MALNRAYVEAGLAGVPLPATRQELLAYARSQGDELLVAAVTRLHPAREYRSLQDVGEELVPVQPRPAEAVPLPREESDLPPGGERYTAASAG